MGPFFPGLEKWSQQDFRGGAAWATEQYFVSKNSKETWKQQAPAVAPKSRDNSLGLWLGRIEQHLR